MVLDPHPESNGLEQAVRRLERKVEAGARFVVTQPVYDGASARTLAEATGHVSIPVILGVLPLQRAPPATPSFYIIEWPASPCRNTCGSGQAAPATLLLRARRMPASG